MNDRSGGRRRWRNRRREGILNEEEGRVRRRADCDNKIEGKEREE